MDWYPWIVFIHAATVLLFFIAHGASMAVAFTHPERAEPRSAPSAAGPVPCRHRAGCGRTGAIGILTGIARGLHRRLVGPALDLDLPGPVRGHGLRDDPAHGRAPERDAGGRWTGDTPRQKDPPPVEDLGELRRLQAAWNPMPLAVAGIGSFLVILYLMLVKPF